ncbi:hypothetical protein HNQ50_001394 [Silvimonas terrae]|uniref:Uncharacterized protein n=1 Tax=Silvimonas terrae TaxID=300266 RepID=A0A840RED9_9NEIS|nr:hypothetical protein [Silvimonas terrae]MBB5190672.1 hypothetical protein [Silvimonas terrae]
MKTLEALQQAIADVESANMINAKDRAAAALRAVYAVGADLAAQVANVNTRLAVLERRAGILQHTEG